MRELVPSNFDSQNSGAAGLFAGPASDREPSPARQEVRGAAAPDTFDPGAAGRRAVIKYARALALLADNDERRQG